MFAENTLKFIKFNLENFDTIQSVLYGIITLSFILLIFWLIKDISSRIENIYARILVFIGVLVANIPGLIFYLVLRPRETIVEKEERFILEKRQEVTIMEQDLSVCPDCAAINKASFKHCVHCSRKLEIKCLQCDKDVQPQWNFCPNCRLNLHQAPLKEAKLPSGKTIQKPNILINSFNGIFRLILGPFGLVVSIFQKIYGLLNSIYRFVEKQLISLDEKITVLESTTKLNEAVIGTSTANIPRANYKNAKQSVMEFEIKEKLTENEKDKKENRDKKDKQIEQKKNSKKKKRRKKRK